jgi:predicted ATPase
VEFDAWQTFQTESLRLDLTAALAKLAQGLAGRGDHAAALAHGRRWLALDPLHEPAQRLIMRLHAGAGDRAAAIRQYRECVKLLQDELGVEPELETIALFEAIRSGTAGETSPALRRPESLAPAHNLPSAPTPFIGREPELAQLATQLADSDCRLLTILGPGCIGKTRLAVRAAQAAADRFAHGACFVDLAPIASAELLASTILRTLQAPSFGAAEPDQHVLSYLAGKQMLLVLDNYEHLLTGAEPDRRDGYGLVTKILDAAPRVKLLVTSRARLNVRAEWLAPLEGMEAPEDGEPEALEARRPRSDTRGPTRASRSILPADLSHYSATALFLACVRRVRPGYQPGPDDARHIVRICRLLDGIPLAIELAAAWTRTLPLAKIADELAYGLDVLTTPLRDVPARHRSMTAAFDHSWRLLSSREQSLLRQLSVFPGSWTDEAAAAVAGATVSELRGLADASWLRLTSIGRHEMHMLIKQYCARKLATEHEDLAGENADRVRERYAAFYLARLLARQASFYRQPASVAEMAAELHHLLAAWNWFTERNDLEAVRALTPGLSWIAVAQGWERAFRAQMERCARQLAAYEVAGHDDPDRRRDTALVRATVIAEILDELLGLSNEAWQGWVSEAESLLAQVTADDARWLEVRWTLRFRIAMGCAERGNDSEAVRRLQPLLPDLDAGRLHLWPYCNEALLFPQMRVCRCLGLAALKLGHDQEARRLAEQSIARAEHAGAPFFKLAGLLVLSSALNSLGEHRQAAVPAREYLRVLRAHGIKAYHSLALMLIGTATAGQGDTLRARACFRRALAVDREIGQFLPSALQHMGTIELALGNLAQARRFYREKLSLCAGQGLSEGLAATLTGLARIALAHGKAAEARAHLRRALLTPSQARSPQQTIDALATWSELLSAEGQHAAAAELCAALLSWPATPVFSSLLLRPLRADLAARLRELEAQLPPAVFAAAAARGRCRQVDEMVAEIAGG